MMSMKINEGIYILENTLKIPKDFKHMSTLALDDNAALHWSQKRQRMRFQKRNLIFHRETKCFHCQ